MSRTICRRSITQAEAVKILQGANVPFCDVFVRFLWYDIVGSLRGGIHEHGRKIQREGFD